MKTEFLLDYSTILANQARPVHLAIRFQAEGALNPRPRPAAFCVVLDRSGSMEGPPLDHAKQAANHGIVEPPAVRQVVVGGLEQDAVRTSCLGFGDNYNEDLMAELARATNGQFYDADSPETFPAIFASELDGRQRHAVQNLRVRVQALDLCGAYTLLGEYPALALPDGRMEFAIGDPAGADMQGRFAGILPPKEPNPTTRQLAKVVYQDKGAGLGQFTSGPRLLPPPR